MESNGNGVFLQWRGKKVEQMRNILCCENGVCISVYIDDYGVATHLYEYNYKADAINMSF